MSRMLVVSKVLLFTIPSRQETPKIERRHLRWNASKRFACYRYVFQANINVGMKSRTLVRWAVSLWDDECSTLEIDVYQTCRSYAHIEFNVQTSPSQHLLIVTHCCRKLFVWPTMKYYCKTTTKEIEIRERNTILRDPTIYCWLET